MKSNLWYLFLAFSIICCRKSERIPQSSISGVVRNATSDSTIAGAYIYAEIRMPDWLGNQPSKPIYTLTDHNGYYKLEVPEGYQFQLVSISKSGFLPSVFPGKGHDLQAGEENILNVQLIPEDGYILLRAINDLPGNDSVYVAFFSPIQADQFMLKGEVFPSSFPITGVFQGQTEELLDFPSEDEVQVYWDTKPFQNVIEAANHASIYLSRFDTVIWDLHY